MHMPIHGSHADQSIAFQHAIPLDVRFAIAKLQDGAREARPHELPSRANIRKGGTFLDESLCEYSGGSLADGRAGTAHDRVFRDADGTFRCFCSRRKLKRTDCDVQGASTARRASLRRQPRRRGTTPRWPSSGREKTLQGSIDVRTRFAWFVELRRTSTRRCARRRRDGVRRRSKRGGRRRRDEAQEVSGAETEAWDGSRHTRHRHARQEGSADGGSVGTRWTTEKVPSCTSSRTSLASSLESFCRPARPYSPSTPNPRKMKRNG